MELLDILNRSKKLFTTDVERYEAELLSRISGQRYLVIGGAGSIGQAVTIELFKRKPKLLHVVDLSENSLVELVRQIRSTLGYIDGEFRTFALDAGSKEFDALLETGSGYDVVLNLSALKHVRSEKDPFSLHRMVQVNVVNVASSIEKFKSMGVSKYFCVSTDKAANPVNMMGASKRIMEMFAMEASSELPVSMARFANVAFSDGSLLHGFNQRFIHKQPISAPSDVLRYFITPQEAGELCLLSCLLGQNREIFFPKNTDELQLTRFSEVAVRFLENLGYETILCDSEEEARAKACDFIAVKKWPVYFFTSDTTGEKPYEEFFTEKEDVDLDKFEEIGVIRSQIEVNNTDLTMFLKKLDSLRENVPWNKSDLVDLFRCTLPGFEHEEMNKSLDEKM